MRLSTRLRAFCYAAALCCVNGCATTTESSWISSVERLSLIGVSPTSVEKCLRQFCRSLGRDKVSIVVAFDKGQSFSVIEDVMEELGYDAVDINVADDGMFYDQCVFQRDPVSVFGLNVDTRKPMPKFIGKLWEEGALVSWGIGGNQQYLCLPRAQVYRFIEDFKGMIDLEVAMNPRWVVNWDDRIMTQR